MIARWFIHDENTAPIAPQSCCVRILRERLAVLFLDALLVLDDQRRPVVGGEIGVERVALLLLVAVEQLLEMVVIDPEHDVGIHRDEAAVES